MDRREQEKVSCPQCGSDDVYPENIYQPNSVPSGRSKLLQARRNVCKSCGIYYNPEYAK